MVAAPRTSGAAPAEAPATPLAAGPSASTGKTAASTPIPPEAGSYPYPVDAGPNVVTGELSLNPAQAAAEGGFTVTVASSASGWRPGQKIFIYLGQRYELTLVGPGAAGQMVVPAGAVGSGGVTVSGFQFPGDTPAAPVDGAGTRTLGASG